jgi:hypothetical protein
MLFFFLVKWLTVCVTGKGGRGQGLGAEKKLEATLREMLENGDESHQSGARFVGQQLIQVTQQSIQSL